MKRPGTERKLTRALIVKEIDAIESRNRREIEDLAQKVRREILMPLCKEHDLDYFAGNGETFFVGDYHDEDGSPSIEVKVGSSYEAANEFEGQFIYLKDIFRDVVNLAVGRDGTLGLYIQSIKIRGAGR